MNKSDTIFILNIFDLWLRFSSGIIGKMQCVHVEAFSWAGFLKLIPGVFLVQYIIEMSIVIIYEFKMQIIKCIILIIIASKA